MAIDVVCPDCGSRSQLDEGRVGRLTPCPTCQALFVPTPQTLGRHDAEPSLVEILNEAPPAPRTQPDTTTATATVLTDTPPESPAISSSPVTSAPVAPTPGRGFFAPPDRARAGLLNRMAQDDDDVEDHKGFFAPEKRAISKGMLGGIVMMLVAGIWFFWGLSAGVYYFYPPILFLIGVYAFAKGLATGNLFGNR